MNHDEHRTVVISLSPTLSAQVDKLLTILSTTGETVDTAALEKATAANDAKTTAILNIVSANKP